MEPKNSGVLLSLAGRVHTCTTMLREIRSAQRSFADLEAVVDMLEAVRDRLNDEAHGLEPW